MSNEQEHIKTIKKHLDYLLSHNKNYTKSQYFSLLEISEQIEKLNQPEPQPSTKIFINSQLGDKKSAELNAQNFPRLFDGQKQIRNISIIETAQGLDIQAILTPLEIEQEITQFLRNKYQAK